MSLTCPSCGYDLNGLPAAKVLRCPECGTDVLFALLESKKPPSLAREMTRVIAVPIAISGYCLVTWSMGDLLLMFVGFLGAAVASVCMAIMHSIERKSGLEWPKRRQLLVIGLIMYAAMLSLAYIVTMIAAERIANV